MLRNLFEKRAISFQTIWGAGGDVFRSTLAGPVIDETTALRIGTVYACIRLISDSIATLPTDTFVRISGERRVFRPRPAWVDDPDVDAGVSRIEHTQQLLISLLLNGNSFTRIFRDNAGDVAALTVLNPTKVEVQRNSETRQIQYIYDYKEVIAAEDMIHLTELRLPQALRGESRISLIKEELGLSAALAIFAQRFFAGSANPAGIIEVPTNITREQAVDLVNAFDASHKGLEKTHKTGVLFGGAKFNQTQVDNETSQMLDSRKFSVEEIARIFRVPLFMLSSSATAAQGYNSVEAHGISFIRNTLLPYITRIEQAYSRLLPAGVFLRFNVDALQRADIQTRFSSYSQGIQAGFLTVNDVRRLEDLSAVDGGEILRVPLANVNIEAASLQEMNIKTQMAQRLVLAGYEPGAVLAALNMPRIEHSGVPSTQLQPLAQLDPENPTELYRQ